MTPEEADAILNAWEAHPTQRPRRTPQKPSERTPRTGGPSAPVRRPTRSEGALVAIGGTLWGLLMLVCGILTTFVLPIWLWVWFANASH